MSEEHHHNNHGHDHDHHHHHDHHEESAETAWGSVGLEAHVHEQAVTVSMSLHPAEGEALAFGDIVALMQRIAEDAEAAGGVVGHIKAFARQGDAFAHASVTAADIEPSLEGSTEATFGAQSDIQLVAIVLLVTQDELVRICKHRLA